MSLFQLLLVFKHRYKILLMTLLVSVATAIAVTLVMPKTYKATTALVLNYKGVDPISGVALAPNLMPNYLATQIDIINRKSLALRVIGKLDLVNNRYFIEKFRDDTGGEGDMRDWLAEQLLLKLDASPSRQSSVLDINFKAHDAKLAATIANAFASEYQATALQINTEPVKRVSTYFDEQLKVLSRNLEVAQEKLSAKQQQKNLTSMDSRYDIEAIRLTELSNQLVQVQAQMIDATSRQQQVQGPNAREAPDVIGNPLIQSLKTLLAQSEAQFDQIAVRYEKDHPAYERAKADVDRLRRSLGQTINATANSISNNARILTKRESDLKKAYADQKIKVLDANRARDELSIFAREVDSAQRAYDALIQRFNQARLEAQANQTDIAVLSAATPPGRPSSPRLVLNIVLALGLGGVIGLGVMLLTELYYRPVRNARDLTHVLKAPVLGVMTGNSWSSAAPRALALTAPRRLLSK
jgi:chain length determinant protein EpsF